MKQVNKINKKYLYIIIALLFGIIIGYFLISNVEVIGNATETVFTKGLTESSPDLKEHPFTDQLQIVGAPTATPESGTYNLNQSVTLSSTTPGATIRYTLNGSEPTESSSIYSSPIAINQSLTLKAKAYKYGFPESRIVSFIYTINKVETPIANPQQNNVSYNTQISLYTPTNDATIRYTIDGSSPTESSEIYSAPFTITGATTIKARAFKNGFQPSDVAIFNYVVNVVAIPTSLPSNGNVNYGTSVSLNTSTSGAVIRYTLDGTEPTESSEIYSAPFTITGATTIKARAFKSDWQPSEVITFYYTVTNMVAAPTSSPTYGNVSYGANVTLHTATMGADIRYTLDGTEPNEMSAVYYIPFTITENNTVIKAKAYKPGLYPSATVTFHFTYQTVSDPTSSPSYGDVNYGINATLHTATTEATIRYTIDGSEPNETSEIYFTPFIINDNITIKAKAYKPGWKASNIITFNYTIQTVSDIVAYPIAKTYVSSQEVTLQTATTDAIIRYTLDGTEPNENSEIYSGPLTITETTTLKARAFKPGWKSSNVFTGVYTIKELPYVWNYMEGDNPVKLYIYPTDSAKSKWGCLGVSIGGEAQNLTDGARNTAGIIAGCAERPIAASVCSDLDFGGYDDWYLPARNQLLAIWDACEGAESNECMNAAINKGDYASSWVNLTVFDYWSSTEAYPNKAKFVSMYDGSNQSILNHNKDSKLYVRCVRSP